MFRKPDKSLIGSDTDFSVEEITRIKLVYREGGKTATLSIEPTANPSELILYLAVMTDCWDPPFDNVRISDEHWLAIGEKVREACRSQGIKVLVSELWPQAERDAFRRSLPPP